MSKILEALKAKPDTALGGTGTSFIDADTLVDETGEKYRVQGLDAAEVVKYLPGKGLKEGTAGGEATTDAVSKLANEEGFTSVAPRMRSDGQPERDQFGRILTDLRNAEGKSFSTELLKAGAFDINTFTHESQRAARDIADAKRQRAKVAGTYEETAFDIAAKQINMAELAEGQKQQGFKQALLNEQEYAQMQAHFMSQGMSTEQARNETLKFTTGQTQIDNYDRNTWNESNNPLSDSWDQGWIGAKEGMYGALQMFGEEFNNEWANDLGEDGIRRMQIKQQDFASTLTDYKDVNSFGTAMQFLGNNIAMSLPYMAITAGGAAVGTAATAATGGGALAAAAGLGLGLSAPATVYTGQVWNEMEGEKSAAVAVGAGLVQASLDRLGLGGLAGKLVPDRAFTQGVKHIMKQQKVTKEVAEDILSNATKVEARGMMQDAIKVAGNQLKNKQIGMDLLKRASIDGATEGVTEMGQEATAYLASTMGSDKVFNWEELNERMIAAAIAGTAIGGAIATPSGLRQSVIDADLKYGSEAATDTTASTSQQYAEQERAEKGYIPTIEEEISSFQNTGYDGFENQQSRAERYKSKHKAKSFTEKAAAALLNPQALWKGATANIFTPELQSRSRSARVMADMFGGNLQRVFAGSSFENFKFHQVAQYKNLVPQPDKFFSAMGRGKKLTKSMKQQISETSYTKMNAALDAEGNFNPDSIADTDPDKAAVVAMANQLNQLSDKMYLDQKKYNPELGYTKNYLMKYKAMNKKAVRDNRTQFEKLLQSDYQYNKSDAVKLTDEIINNGEVADIDDAFSVIKGGVKPASHKQRSLGLSENKNFGEFMEKDIFANISQATKSAARYTAHQKYLGPNSSVISNLLDQMEAEGLTKEEVDKVAAGLQDYLDAESGNYNRPKTVAGKKAQAMQKNVMAIMTLAGLPLATISSFVEVMLVNRGLTTDQVWGKDGSMKHMGTELGKTLWSGMKTVGSYAAPIDIDTNPQSAARDKLRDLGFYEWDVGAATVTGVTEVNAWQQEVYEGFFNVTGLTGWTNYTRAARAAMGLDYIVDNADTYWAYKMGNQEYTRDVQQAEEKLRNLGIDPDRFADIQTKKSGGMELDPAEQKIYDDAIREGTFNFVNEAIALPQAANRPLIYQDPRFALFTQFQGFMATFTANHIPKLWGEYVKRGTPGMKYNAFATAATMIMMGFASQHIKDIVKYGDDDGDDDTFADRKTGLNPYLETPEYLRRGISASGLLGTGERVLNFAFPIYEQQNKNAGDWAFNSAVGESPALGWLQRAANATGHAASGDVGRGVEQALKATPLLGPFSLINKKAGELASNWNFNGESQ